MIAAERRYIAAASVADLTDNTTELALPAAPRLTNSNRGTHEVTYTTRQDVIGSERGDGSDQPRPSRRAASTSTGRA
jgi:hypothetical protein